MFQRMSRGLLFVCLVGYASCRPEAEAAAAADAEPDADAYMPNAYLDMNGQLVTGGMNSMPSMPGAYPDASGNIVGNGLGPWNPAGGDPCSAQAQDSCCTERQRPCYTTYKTVCPETGSSDNCRKGERLHTEVYYEKSCRKVPETKNLNVPVMSCKPKEDMVEVTFNVTKCERESVTVTDDVTIDDESVNVGQMEDKCIPVTKCRLEEVQETKTRMKSVQKCEPVPVSKPQCTIEVVEQPPLIQTKVVYEARPVKECKPMRKMVCSPSGCTEYGCINPRYPNTCSTAPEPGPTGPCSYCSTGSGDYCPNDCAGSAPAPPQPQCGQEACYRSQSQICCRYEYQNVCVTRIERKPNTVQVSVPRPPIKKNNCTMVTEYKQTCKMVQEPETYEITVKKCNNYQDQYCFQIPSYNVEPRPRTITLEEQGQTCTEEVKPVTQKIPVPAGVDCHKTERTVRKQVTRTVCDRQIPRQKQFKIPYEVCERGPSPQCKTVPELVCPPQPQPQPQPPCKAVRCSTCPPGSQPLEQFMG